MQNRLRSLTPTSTKPTVESENVPSEGSEISANQETEVHTALLVATAVVLFGAYTVHSWPPWVVLGCAEPWRRCRSSPEHLTSSHLAAFWKPHRQTLFSCLVLLWPPREATELRSVNTAIWGWGQHWASKLCNSLSVISPEGWGTGVPGLPCCTTPGIPFTDGIIKCSVNGTPRVAHCLVCD